MLRAKSRAARLAGTVFLLYCSGFLGIVEGEASGRRMVDPL